MLSRLAILLLVAMLAVPAPAREWLQRQPVQSLDGKSMHLPADLPPCPVLLVIGFTRASSEQTTPWSRRLRAHDACGTGLVVYQVAVVEDIPVLFRGLAVRGMRKSVPVALHPRFLLVDTHASYWQALAGHGGGDAAHLVLLDSDRTVRWRHAGAWTPADEAALRDAVAATKAP